MVSVERGADVAAARTAGPVAVPYGCAVYNELMGFLIEEARLLDENLLAEWLALLAEDLTYTMPVRQTVSRRSGNGFDLRMGHFDDDFESITLRVRRLVETETAYAEDPPSRVRRFVTNVVVHDTDTDGEYAVTSYLLLVRNRWDNPSYDIVSAARHDLVRRAPTGFRLARRQILVDQSTLGTHNMAIFL